MAEPKVKVPATATRKEREEVLARLAAGDIDLLVEFEPGRTLLDHAALVADLEELLGCKVDGVTESGLYWLLRRRILEEARAL